MIGQTSLLLRRRIYVHISRRDRHVIDTEYISTRLNDYVITSYSAFGELRLV